MKIFFLSIFSLILILVIASTLHSDNKFLNQLYPKKNSYAAGSPFVTRLGKNLYLNDELYRFIGLNKYNLLTTGTQPSIANPGETTWVGCGAVFTQDDLNSWISEASSMGVTAVRISFFQSYTQSGEDLAQFDYLLNLAAQHNIKLVPSLENQWADCTQGGYKYNTWYESGYLSPYGTYPISYKEYVRKVVTRYKDNPNILMWQLIGEAESKDINDVSDPVALYNFTVDMSAFIKSIDSNHLISLGTIGGGQLGTEGNNYRNLHAIPTIDILDYHDYHNETNIMHPNLQERFNDSVALNKPLFIAEGGIASNCTGETSGFTCYPQAQRATYIDNKLSNFFLYGGVGYMIWEYRNPAIVWGEPHITFGLEFDYSDPLVQKVASQAANLSLPPQPTPTANPSPTPTVSTPTVTLNVPCISGPVTGSTEVTISWTTPVDYVNIAQTTPIDGLTPNVFNKQVSGIFTTYAPQDFNLYPQGSPALTMYPDTTYYTNVFNGNHSNTTPFMLPSCPSPSPTPTPLPDTTPPAISITFPQDNALVNRNTIITITATAADDRGVDRVEFFVNNILSCTDTVAPYTCVWQVPGGAKKTYTLAAKAYDTSFNTATSSIHVKSK